MDKAKTDILVKFEEIESKEDFLTFEFGGQVKVIHDLAVDIERTFVSLFDLHVDRSGDGVEGQTDDEEGMESYGDEDDDQTLTTMGPEGEASLDEGMVSKSTDMHICK